MDTSFGIEGNKMLTSQKVLDKSGIKRILQVVGTMDMGGIETLLMNIYRKIDRSKYQFDFLCHNRIESHYAREIEALGGRMFVIPGISHIGYWAYCKRLYKFFCEHPEFCAVHSHHNQLSGIILKQAKKAQIPIRIAHSHSVFSPKSLKSKLIFSFFQYFFRGDNLTRALACSHEAGITLYPAKWRNNFEVVSNVIDTQKFMFNIQYRQTIRNELNLHQCIVFGHVGRFAKVKNQKHIIDIFYKYWSQVNKNSRLLLIGEGEMKKEMEAYVSSLGGQAVVHFLGGRNDVYACLSAMDIFIFPSLVEGLPVSLVEAQASGLPILASTAIASDAIITDLVCRLELSAPLENWVAQLERMASQLDVSNRADYASNVRSAGFDVVQRAEWFESLYCN